jgi:hypothetical protein
MKLFDTKINCFGGRNRHQRQFCSLHWNLVSISLFFYQKIKKMKFSTKIKFSKIKEIGYIIDKKIRSFQTNFKVITFYVCFFHFGFLFFNLIFFKCN